ncbi:DUF4183 domain-containing protein [Sporosarcina sp. FSL K6-1540]|uniref:DUF4183 domain-containing protein n=1 Tax=unclassified Sporosarcina TaxID=2647733 RepID=UPI0030FCC1F8
MERHKKCKKVVRMIDYKNYSQKIVCQTPIEVIPTNNSEFSIIPTVKRYFYIPVANINVTNGVTIPANLFYNDDGSPTIEFMNFSPNGYANLYINALMQEGGMYEVSTNSLTISPANAIIYARTPIIVELLSFSTKLI